MSSDSRRNVTGQPDDMGTIPQLQMDGAQVSGHEESSMMRSARDRTMPKLQPADMQSDEVSRIQTQLEMLERQVSEFGGYRRQPRVSRDVIETEHGDRGRTLEGLQVGTSNVETDSPRPKEYGDDFRPDRVKPEHLTSTPRYEAGGGRNNRHMREAEYAGEPVRKSGGIKMKPATYDGSGSWLDYKAHFEVCADLNEWSQREQGMYLAASLRGQAQAVFGNLPRGSYDYDDLVKCLEERFAPPNQTELHRVQLRERRQRASETLSELGQDVRRLTNLAYPTAPSDLRETLAKEQFVDALVSSDMRLRIKQARPHDLNDAVRHAVELEAFDRAERKHMEGQGYMRTTSERSPGQDNTMDRDFKALQKSVAELQQSFTTWKLAQANPLTNVSYKPRNTGTWTGTKRKCFICGSEDHLRLNCPRNPQKQGKNTDDKKHQGKYVATTGSGLYAECRVNDLVTDCLIDTGASLTIVSLKTWDNIKASCPELTVFKPPIFTASGKQVDVQGQTQAIFELSGVKSITEIIIADIDVDVILGLDFLKANKCQIDAATDTLKIKGQSCKLNMTGKVGCYRVTVSETVEVPSRSEMVIEGKVTVPRIRKDDLGLVEPIECSFKSGNGFVAKTLVHTNDTIPLRVMNLSDDDEKLYAGKHVANLSFVTGVHKVKCPGTTARGCNQVPSHLKDMYEETIIGLSPEQCDEVAKLLQKHESTFSKSDVDLGRTGIIRHRITTGDARPIKQPIRRLPHHMNQEAEQQINGMLEKDVIQPSSSPWASGIVLVQKKDGSKRFCVDYRRLNDVTIKDAYPIPRIDDSLDQLAGAQWFSCLDLNSGYWQVEVDDQDRQKTAFASRHGLFEFKVMPFGLCNAPATFERLMETVLAGLNWQVCLVYLDDIIITGKTFADMITNLELVMGRLSEAGLKLKPRKCQLFKREVEFLGHVISQEGVKTDPKKIEVVRDWPKPENIHALRSFLGFCSYYRRFIPNFAEMAKPLHCLSEKGQRFVWSEKCNLAFEILKQKLVEAPVLAHPDFSEPFILDTDASDLAIGAVLSQNIGGQEHVIAYASRTLTKAEKRYCVTRKELLALVHFVKYFRHYLYGKAFTVRTDHSSLRWLMNFKNPEGQMARWLEVLSAYDMKIVHRPGRLHQNADGLSRMNTCYQCGLLEAGRESLNTMHVNPVMLDDEPTTVVDIKTTQDSDADIRLVKTWITTGTRPEHRDIGSGGRLLKSMWSQWPRLSIKDGVLVRRWEVLGTDIVYWQAVVPLGQRRIVLKYTHDVKTSGHLGVLKTLSKIRQRYYWPGLQQDVRAYIAGCETCSRRKGPTMSKTAPMQIVRSGYPMERIALDILGEFPISENGNKYILVIADYFTKWTECCAMPNMEAATVAKILVNEVISRFGIPDRIHSDQGRQFESGLFSELCKLLQMEKTRTTPYHPQSDGMVERFNRTLASMLSMFVDDNHRNWDEQIPFVMMAYRAAEHETTGLTPNMVMLGRETTTPLDMLYEMPPSIAPIPVNKWAWELKERLEKAHTFVRQNTGQSMQRQKKYRDRKLSYEVFEPGNNVYVYFPVKKVGCSSKLTSYWRGPYQVSEKLSDVLYKVNCGRAGSPSIIHCDRMRRAKEQLLTGENTCREIPADESEVPSDNEVRQTISEDELVVLDPEVRQTISEDELDHEELQHEVRPSKRQIRKPIWTKDYYLSTCRLKMPLTKTTPRKRCTCPVCKETIPMEQFIRHVTNCPEARHKCTEAGCSSTFKKTSYMLKHRKRMHDGTNKATANTSVTQNTEDSESSSESGSESDPWDNDPEINLGEGQCTEKSAPMIRKPTRPAPVPSGRKPVADTAPKESVGTDNVGVPEPKRTRKEVSVNISVCKRQRVSQELNVKENDQKVFGTFRAASGPEPTQEAPINLGDFLPGNVVLRPQDITISRSLTVDGGEVSMTVTYDSV